MPTCGMIFWNAHHMHSAAPTDLAVRLAAAHDCGKHFQALTLVEVALISLVVLVGSLPSLHAV